MTTPKILVFDSGVGGLSVVAELRRLVPSCQLIFACDNEAFPYGTKTEAELVDRVDLVLKTLIRKMDPDIIVVACNSASTLVLEQIRSHFTRPVVGVVPAIKPAARLSKSKVIGLLATPGTVQRSYTKQLIQDFAPDCEVVSVGSSDLVQLAEKKLRGETLDPIALKAIMQPFQVHPMLDTIVLACTHFPLIQAELSAALVKEVNWIDSGEAIARRVNSLIPDHHHSQRHTPADTAYFTRQNSEIEQLRSGLVKFGYHKLDVIEVIDQQI